MRWTFKSVVIGVMCLAGAVSAQPAQRRVALVIGNAAYTTPGWQLRNPVNDARLIADRLRPLGFDVDTVLDADKATMERAFQRFATRLRSAGPDAVGMFYYAGHAAEQDGANLLVPVDVSAASVDELRYQAPPMQFVLRDMARAGNPVNIVILDACRNLPLPSGTRAGPAGGLALLDDTPPDVLIAYATRAGQTAPDNPDETNSVFTRTLAEALSTRPDEPLVMLMSAVQAKVFADTGQSQRPEFRSALLRASDFRLVEPTSTKPVANAAPPQAPADPLARYRTDATWKEHENGFYRLTPTRMPIEDARAYARAQGGRLVTINDQAEQDFIVRSFGAQAPLWLGLSDDRREGEWRWSNGEPVTFTAWKPGEPSGRLFGAVGSDEDFVVINPASGGRWSDVKPSDMRLIGNAWGVVEVRR